MKILILGYIHHKNKLGIEMICKYLKYEYKFSDNYEEGFDILYSPSVNITVNIPTIYGPHFSVFPNDKALALSKGIYIQPSDWVKNSWNKLKNIPIKSFPFPVDVDKFKSDKKDRQNIILYYKQRDKKELLILKNFLNKKNIKYKLFSYDQKYKEEDYLNYLKNTKYMIVLGIHESQGFAIEEALSCDVPLLVWNVKHMNQEINVNYDEIPATSIPYWDERCGEFFYEKEELINFYNKFINNLNNYKPREYILENLTTEKCSERFKNLLNLLNL